MTDGIISDSGEVLESVPPRRLVIRWQHQLRPELQVEGYSRCVIELEPRGDAASRDGLAGACGT